MSDQTRSGATAAPTPTDPIEMTPEGKKQLLDELARLTEDRRPELVKQVQRAKLFLAPEASTGAVSVAEYDLSILDRQIEQLTELIERIKVIPLPPDDRTVRVGSRVEVRYDKGSKDSETLTIVGPYEGDPMRGFVSSESALGTAMLGKSDGDKVKAGSGDDALELTVVKIGKEKEPTPTDAPTEEA